jgi:KUP system potassium uptake protein
MTYDVNELIDDKIIKVNLHCGFRIQARSELFFKRIMQELVENKELNLHIRPDGSTKYNSEADFKFVVIEKFISVENQFSLKESLMLNSYFLLKRLGLSDEKAFGLDKSDVVVEYFPLVYNKIPPIELKRASR